jgi:hypothetical protein
VSQQTPVAYGITLKDGTPALLVISDHPLRKRQVVRLLTDGVHPKVAQVESVLHEEMLGEAHDEFDVFSLATVYGQYATEDYHTLGSGPSGR